MTVTRQELLRYMRGHHATQEIIDRERAHRLGTLTVEESLREYAGLCDTWEAIRAAGHAGDVPAVDPARLEVVQRIRMAMALAWQRRGQE